MKTIRFIAKILRLRLMSNMFLLAIRSTLRIANIFIPRDNNVWIVGSWFGERFADNSRYFYEEMYNGKYDKEVYWITKNKSVYEKLNARGYKVLRFWSIKTLYIHLKAGLIIYDMSYKDVNYLFTSGAVHFNLWHGIPLKKIGSFTKSSVIQKKSLLDFVNSRFTINEYILATSVFTQNILKEAFEVQVENCIIATYPRNLYLEDLIKIEEKHDHYLQSVLKENKKIVLYLPTFRDKSKVKFFGEENVNIINQHLEQISNSGYVIVTKMHFAETLYHQTGISVENVINLPSDYDIYPMLKYADVLITDYSSVYFDYLTLNREIIFFPYDLEYYKNEDRGLLFDYDEFTPGEKIMNICEVLPTLIKISNKEINYSEDRLKLKNLIFCNRGFDSLVSAILKILK